MRQRQIMVVDDEPLVCETVIMLLESEGHRVTRAHSAQQALSLFQPGKFDLIFTDFFMPWMTGEQLAYAIKSQCPAQPVVMLTAYSEKLQSWQRPASVVDLFIGKPFELDSLRAAITKLSPAPGPSMI
jgi:two-component system cell cycle sensor histidine kinase/response regulator CckA